MTSDPILDFNNTYLVVFKPIYFTWGKAIQSTATLTVKEL